MRLGFWSACILFLLAINAPAATVLEEKRGGVVARAEIDRDEVSYSGQVALMLTVEGPGRVEVAPPRPLLTKDSAQAWLVREAGLPTVEKLDGDRTRWRQEFRLSPFVEPRAVIALAPLKVRAGGLPETEITWTGDLPVRVVVRKDVKVDAPPKTVTGIETLPPALPAPPSDRGGLIVASVAVAAILLIAVAVVVVRRRQRRPAATTHSAEWAISELAGTPAFARMSEVLRLYLQHRFDIPATRLTTAELVAALRQGDRLSSPLDAELESILERCDVAKFAEGAGPAAGADDVAAWADRARAFVAGSSSPESAAAATSSPA